MLDYHLHLWPHERADTWFSIDQIADYCEMAAANGVTELALTEHLHRFHQTADLVGPFWKHTETDPVLQDQMAAYFDHHARSDLDAYVTLAQEAKNQGLPVKIGMEVDFYRGQMDVVGELLGQYPFDVLIGSVHWLGAWQFDDIDNPVQMAEWSTRQVDQCWAAYSDALEELAATGTCDVLAHPDLIKVAGYVPGSPSQWWDQMAEAAARHGMAAELSSAGWKKPIGEQYPSESLLERFVAAGVPMTTASDAHSLGRVAERSGDLRALLDGLGVTTLASFDGRKRRDVPVGGE